MSAVDANIINESFVALGAGFYFYSFGAGGVEGTAAACIYVIGENTLHPLTFEARYLNAMIWPYRTIDLTFHIN